MVVYLKGLTCDGMVDETNTISKFKKTTSERNYM